MGCVARATRRASPDRDRHVLAGVPCGIFVATTGTHDAGCGLSRDSPCRTVQEGIDRAVAEGATCVNVQAGVYTQTISLAAGVSVIGGFDVNWQPGPYTTAGHVTEIRGVAKAVDGQSQAVVARNLTPAPVLTNLVLTGPNASGFMTGTNSGKSSYVVHVFGGNLVMRNCRLNCGNGANGTAGAGGTDAISVLRIAAMNGQGGGNGASSVEFCNDTSRGASGLKGQNGSCASANGGDGGRGGTMDSDCAIPRDFNANVGENGNPATTVLGTVGLGSPGSAQCAKANAGNPGRIQNGAAGAGGGVTPDVIGAPAYLRGRAGAAAGGGLFGGGGAGGGSYGIVLIVAHADVADLDIVRGNGGTGARAVRAGAASRAASLESPAPAPTAVVPAPVVSEHMAAMAAVAAVVRGERVPALCAARTRRSSRRISS